MSQWASQIRMSQQRHAHIISFKKTKSQKTASSIEAKIKIIVLQSKSPKLYSSQHCEVRSEKDYQNARARGTAQLFFFKVLQVRQNGNCFCTLIDLPSRMVSITFFLVNPPTSTTVETKKTRFCFLFFGIYGEYHWLPHSSFSQCWTGLKQQVYLQKNETRSFQPTLVERRKTFFLNPQDRSQVKNLSIVAKASSFVIIIILFFWVSKGFSVVQLVNDVADWMVRIRKSERECHSYERLVASCSFLDKFYEFDKVFKGRMPIYSGRLVPSSA